MTESKLDLVALKSFLLRSNQPHATGTAQPLNEKDGSRTIVFTDGDWAMHDNFFGGEPYGGRQVISYQGKAVWMMVYYGRVESSNFVPETLYGFLREALQHGTIDQPYRGPNAYTKDKLDYQNEVTGSIESFAGQEQIFDQGERLYWAKYMGGLVDQRFSGSL
jgi:hypothetical protein